MVIINKIRTKQSDLFCVIHQSFYLNNKYGILFEEVLKHFPSTTVRVSFSASRVALMCNKKIILGSWWWKLLEF